MKNSTFTRKFPKILNHTSKDSMPYSYEDGLESFYDYCSNLWLDLSLIDDKGKSEKKIFKELSGNTVDYYMNMLLNYYDKINTIIIKKDKYEQYRKRYKDYPYGFITNIKFCGYGCLNHINKDVCKLDKDGKILCLKDKYYNQVESLVNKIFAIEKYCSLVCKKIWKNELTKIKDFNLKDDYKILVKHIYRTGWRKDRYDDKLQKFLKSKKYQSASLISKKNHSHFYNYYKNQISALLIYEPNVSNIVCTSHADGYTEEFINGKNPCKDIQDYTDIDKIEMSLLGDVKREIYAKSTKVSTPNSLLSNESDFNEVLMREPKVVGVLAVDKNGIEFAKEQAEKFNVPYYGILNKQITNETKSSLDLILND